MLFALATAAGVMAGFDVWILVAMALATGICGLGAGLLGRVADKRENNDYTIPQHDRSGGASWHHQEHLAVVGVMLAWPGFFHVSEYR